MIISYIYIYISILSDYYFLSTYRTSPFDRYYIILPKFQPLTKGFCKDNKYLGKKYFQGMGQGGWIGRAQKFYRAVKILFMIP